MLGGQRYSSPDHIKVEGDASSASYFLGGAAITGGRVRVQGCGLNSIQGDVQFATVLERMGAKVVVSPLILSYIVLYCPILSTLPVQVEHMW